MTTNQQTQFQNDNIKLNLKRQPGCRVHLTVDVSPTAVQASRHQALKTINKEVSLPGFRKGKAPEALILQNYSTHIDREWKDVLLNTTLNEALALAKVSPFTRNSIFSASVQSISLEKGATLIYELEEAPHVPALSFEGLAIPGVQRRDVEEKDIAHTLNDLSLQHAEWHEITDRPVKEGDFIDIDVDVLSEPARNICTQTRFEVAKGKMEDWMRKLVIGQKAGQVVEGMTEKEGDHEDCEECHTEGHDHHHHQHDFKPVQCRITIHAIQQAKKPEITDELAKKFGANDANDLKEKVKINLNRRADEERQNSLRQLMEEKLIAQFPFDIPKSLVQEQIQGQKKHIIDSLRAEGVEESNIPSEAKKVEENIARKVDHDMRLYFITQRFANENKIHVPEDEVMMEYMRIMWMNKMGQQTARLPEDPEEAKAQLHYKLMIIKTLDFLIDKVGTGK